MARPSPENQTDEDPEGIIHQYMDPSELSRSSRKDMLAIRVRLEYGVHVIHVGNVSSQRIRCQRKERGSMSQRTKPTPKTTKARTGQQGNASGFGARLRQARRDQGLTLREVSEQSGISITYLSDLEREVLDNPTLDTLTAIASALRVSLNGLLGVDTPQAKPSYPRALEEFRQMAHFQQALEAEERRKGSSIDELEQEWLRCLAQIRISGRTLKSASDYLFVFEAIRRGLVN